MKQKKLCINFLLHANIDWSGEIAMAKKVSVKENEKFCCSSESGGGREKDSCECFPLDV